MGVCVRSWTQITVEGEAAIMEAVVLDSAMCVSFRGELAGVPTGFHETDSSGSLVPWPSV